MSKENVVNIYIMEYYSAIKKEGNLAICDNMDRPEGDILSEVRQRKKDKYHMLPSICGI